MTNAEYIIEALKTCPKDELGRADVVQPDEVKKLSPYFTYATRAGLIEKVSRGVWRKTALLERPMPELVRLMTAESNSTHPQYRKQKAAPAEPDAIEVDVYELLDQLPVETLFDVLAAKLNVALATSGPLARENQHLRDQLALRDQTIKNLNLDIVRLEDRQRQLNGEHERLNALLANDKQKRIVLAKPLNAAGNVVFHQQDGDRKTIKVYRQTK